MDAIEEKVTTLKSQSNDVEYHFVLDAFLAYSTSNIWQGFSIIEETYSIVQTHTDSLQYNLGFEQLTALLHLIWEAGFVKDDLASDKSYFYTFCQKNFSCWNTSKNEYTQLRNVSKKFSEIKNNEVVNALREVYKDLEKTYKKII